MILIPPWKQFGTVDFMLQFEPTRSGKIAKGQAPMDRTVNLKNNRIGVSTRRGAMVGISNRYNKFRRWARKQLMAYALPWRNRHGLRSRTETEVLVACAYRPPADNYRKPDRDGIQTTVMDLFTEIGVYKDDDQVLPYGSWMVAPVKGEPARLWIWIRPIRRIMGTYGPEYETVESEDA